MCCGESVPLQTTLLNQSPDRIRDNLDSHGIPEKSRRDITNGKELRMMNLILCFSFCFVVMKLVWDWLVAIDHTSRAEKTLLDLRPQHEGRDVCRWYKHGIIILLLALHKEEHDYFSVIVVGESLRHAEHWRP